MARTLAVSIVSADAQVWSGSASMVVAKTTEGEIGILVGHEPVLAMLARGEVRVTSTMGETVTMDARDGFLSVENDNVTVIARQAAVVS